MKKNILFGLLVVTSVSVSTFAQSPAAAPAQAPAGKVIPMPQRQMADAATRTQKFTDRMTKTLGLDAATSKKVYDAYLARTKKVDEVQASAVSGKEKNEALKSNKDTFEATLKSILPAEAYDKYSKMESDRKEKPHGDHDKNGESKPQK
jgi:periplasmic protein CpxP/Spy